MQKMFSRIGLVALLGAPAVSAEEINGASYWPQNQLKNYTHELAAKVNEDHFAVERMGEFGNHYVLMVYREGNGPAELHDGLTDFYVVQDGSATLHLGGSIEDAKTVEPGEVRGSSIAGGKTVRLETGDTVNIPPGTPHQIVLAPGEKVTYMIVKVHKQ